MCPLAEAFSCSHVIQGKGECPHHGPQALRSLSPCYLSDFISYSYPLAHAVPVTPALLVFLEHQISYPWLFRIQPA